MVILRLLKSCIKCGSSKRVVSQLCHKCYENKRYHESRPLDENNPCECGCGNPAKKGQKFIHGHNRRGLIHPNSIRFGTDNNKWNGGRRKDIYGYILVLRKDHPFCDVHGYVREHRIIYEESNNCCLLPWTEIHHINGIKNDNRIQNLIALSKKEHRTIHHKGKKNPKKASKKLKNYFDSPHVV